jgi:DNA primase
LSSAPDFSTPRGRAAAARKLATWVSLITDSILREGVMNKVTVRLGVAVAEFAKLLGKPSPSPSGPAEPPPVSSTLLTDPTLRLMTTAALHHAEARAWLLAAPWQELLAREEEAGLLIKVLAANLELDAENPSSMNSFLTTLEPAEEAVISTILHEQPPKHPQMVASDCWNELVSRQIRRHIDSLKARLRTPGLPLEEGLRLSHEVREYQTQLTQIARPAAPPPSA